MPIPFANANQVGRQIDLGRGARNILEVEQVIAAYAAANERTFYKYPTSDSSSMTYCLYPDRRLPKIQDNDLPLVFVEKGALDFRVSVKGEATFQEEFHDHIARFYFSKSKLEQERKQQETQKRWRQAIWGAVAAATLAAGYYVARHQTVDSSISTPVTIPR